MTIDLEFESRSILHPDNETYGLIRICLEVYATGSQDDPCLEVDGDPYIYQVLCDPNIPERVTLRGAFTEFRDGHNIHHSAVTAPNIDFKSKELSMSDFSIYDQKKIEQLIEQTLATLESDGTASELAFEAAICRAEAYADSLEDR